MKYSEWSKEYSDEGKKIKDRINELKARLETASPSEISGISNRISILLTMYLDCMETADELMKKARRKNVEFGN